MKKIFTKLAIILIIPALYFIFISAFSKNEKTENLNPLTTLSSLDTPKFVNMIMNVDHLGCDGIWIGDNLDKYKDSLFYNAAQVYPVDDPDYGQFPTPLTSSQKNNVTNLIDAVQAKNLKFFYEHVFFSYLCYAQRIMYEVPEADSNHGFCYLRINGTLTMDTGRTVIYSEKRDNHDEVLLCDSIYENLQQSDYFGRQHDTLDWFLKPMVRAVINDTVSPNTPIFKIEVRNFSGNIDTSIIITALNFRNNGSYNGEYTDKFYNIATVQELKISGSPTTGLNKGRGDNLFASKVDFKIYTYGHVDFWFDKLTLDDFYANKLFDPLHTNNYDTLIYDELTNVGNAGTGTKLFSYYMDEVTYSQLPCVKYVMDKIVNFNNSYGSNIKFMVSGSNWMAVNKMRNKTWSHKLTLNWLHPRIFNGFAYEFTGDNNRAAYIPAFALGTNNNDSLPDSWKTPYYNIYNNYLQNVVLGNKNHEAGGGISEQGTFIYQVCLLKQAIHDFSPSTMLYFTPQTQGEMWFDGNNLVGIREPLNEEIEAQTMSALAHGVQGLITYFYQTERNYGCPTCIPSQLLGLYGHPNGGDLRRTHNLYGQDKWNFVKKMNKKINSWIPALDTITWLEGYSVHIEGAEHEYIQDIRSIIYHQSGSQSNCEDDPGVKIDCQYERYWEEGFFNPINTTDKSKYFLMVNRRCAPEVEGTNLGDLRFLHIKFKPSNLSEFKNWNLYDVETSELLTTFNKDTNNYIHITREFQPGEGRLFRLAPVMQDGGTLVCDEAPTAGSFICDSTVFNNSYNITLYPSTTIRFNPNGKIVMNGGNFITGSYASNQSSPPRVTLKGNTSQWTGLSFENCDNIEIGTTDFSDICYILNDTIPHNNSAIDIINCFNFAISGNSFDQNTPAHAIHILIDGAGNTEWRNAYIGYNSFSFHQNSQYSINAYSLASAVTPLYITNNNLINDQQQISMAMMLNGVTGGTVRNNIITNFADAIYMTNSTIDLFNNYIYNNIASSEGISGVSGSHINMTPNLGYYTGGSNHIITANNYCKNVNVNNSFFNIQNGSNFFNISSRASSYHLYGTFPGSGIGAPLQNAQGNCFQIDTQSNNPVDSVYWSKNHQRVDFNFTNQNCPHNQFSDYTVFTYSNAFNDTVYKPGSGSGGGEKGFNNEEVTTENNYNIIFDSISLNVRKRDYPAIETQCKYILTNYSDSVKTLAAINWVYFATISRDSIIIRMNSLKSYYETLILNNSGNEALIDRAFYFIQKCKVSLKQYQEAMAGFQIIMEQNPYSYEGLVASWDYAATHLLDSIGGMGGGFNNVQLSMYNVKSKEKDNISELKDEENREELVLYLNIFNNNYDTSKFSKSDRGKLIFNTKQVFENRKNKEIEIIKDLKNRSEKGDKIAMKELETKKAINEAVKIKKPKTQVELKKIISNDVNKIFAKNINNKDEVTKQIPKEFALYQNYPNPFNPVTKISFDLPKDSKVKLIVYDILGREITRLLNSEFRPAGKYVVEFNAFNLNLASGVYFYRIETDKFIAVKKMILIK